ncbi:hypothetical protein D3C74_369190 [compost metagenome]
MLYAIHPFMVHRPVCLQLKLEQEQFLVYHTLASLLALLVVLGLMDSLNGMSSRHKIVLLKQIAWQNFRNHLSILQ